MNPMEDNIEAFRQWLEEQSKISLKMYGKTFSQSSVGEIFAFASSKAIFNELFPQKPGQDGR